MRISDWSSDVCSSDLLPALLARQLLGDQPLAAQRLRDLDLAPEAGIAQRRRSVGDEFAIDPGRGVERRQFFNRYCREDIVADRPAPQLPLFKRPDLDEMVGLYRPDSVGFPLDAAHALVHRLD